MAATVDGFGFFNDGFQFFGAHDFLYNVVFVMYTFADTATGEYRRVLATGSFSTSEFICSSTCNSRINVLQLLLCCVSNSIPVFCSTLSVCTYLVHAYCILHAHWNRSIRTKSLSAIQYVLWPGKQRPTTH